MQKDLRMAATAVIKPGAAILISSKKMYGALIATVIMPKRLV